MTAATDRVLGGAPTPTDSELFAQSVDHPDLLGRVFDRHAPALLRYLTRRLGKADAEDVLGDVFLVALERRGTFDVAANSARPWLYGIASNVLARRHRDETRRLRAYERGDQAPGHSFEDAAVARIDADLAFRRLAGALSVLSAGERDVLLMTAWAHLDQAEVAEALGIPVGTVKSRLHRTRRRLRDALDDHTNNDTRGQDEPR